MSALDTFFWHTRTQPRTSPWEHFGTSDQRYLFEQFSHANNEKTSKLGVTGSNPRKTFVSFTGINKGQQIMYVQTNATIPNHYCCLRRRKQKPWASYVILQVAHAPGMPGTFSPPPRVSDPHMHHGTCVAHVSWCIRGSLTSGFLSSRWWGKRSRHSWHMRNLQFYVSGQRPMQCPDQR